MFKLIAFLFALILIVNAKYYSVLKNSNGYYIEGGRHQDAIATADYDQDMNTKGWNKLFLTAITKNGVSDSELAYASGYLEGSIDPDALWNTLLINLEPYANNTIPSKMSAWLQQNFNWTRTMVSNNPSDSYWIQVGLLLSQLQGIVDGYNHHSPSNKQMSILQLFFINCAGDRDTLNGFLNDTFDEKKPFFSLSEYRQYIAESHCSALIKVPSSKDDLFCAHTTWDTFISMLRTYKIYEFHFSNSPSYKISFSSYPGTLSSIDDFYVTDKGLSVIETTNEFMNKSLFALVVPQNVVSWIRVMVANQATSDGKSWVNTFSRYNSGTYNNQWMITDFKLFDEKSPSLKPNTFWVAEQIPGYIESADMTSVLNSQGYWPSYNIPYFPYIFNISGFGEYVQKYGPWFSYSGSPRAQIFKRDQGNVDSFDSFKWIMRYNDWQHDPISQGNAGNGISSRFDLVVDNNTTNPYLNKAPFGGIDSKATSFKMYQDGMKVHAQSGPTYNQQQVFTWSNWPNVVHPGTPNVYNFDWHEYSAPQK